MSSGNFFYIYNMKVNDIKILIKKTHFLIFFFKNFLKKFVLKFENLEEV